MKFMYRKKNSFVLNNFSFKIYHAELLECKCFPFNYFVLIFLTN